MGLFGKNFDTTAAALSFFSPEAGSMYKRNKAGKRKAAADQAIIDDLIAQARAAGATDADIAAIRANPDKYAEEYNTRFRTRDISPNNEIITPGFGGKRETYRSAPAPTQMEGEFNFIDSLVNRGVVKPEDARGWLKGQINPPQWQRVELPDGSIQMIPVPRNGLPGAPATPAAPPGMSTGPTSAAAMLPHIIQQESGGRPGIRGPQTPYGQPVGLGQTLPATAREMAGKLGLPWRPDLLTGTTPEAAQYQQRLSEAYIQQGLDATGGDPRAAAMYYHGGPNRALWGPKTRRYADEVMRRMGGQRGPIPVRTKAQRDALPPGTQYIAPDGTVMRKR